MTLRYPAPGLCMLALVWLLDLPRTFSRQRTLFFLLSFLLGFTHAARDTPDPAPVPNWLRDAAIPAQVTPGAPPAGPVRLQAKVLSCDILYGNRARVILSQARPAEPEQKPLEQSKGRNRAEPRKPGPKNDRLAASSATEGQTPDVKERAEKNGRIDPATYTGNIVWNWRNPDFIPLPGEVLEITTRLYQVHGFNNPGAWDIDSFWHERGVWFRASSSGATRVEVLEASGPLPRLRRDLLKRFYANLPREEGNPGGAPAENRPTRGGGILPALVFGDRSQLSYEQNELFAKSTLAHSLSISGFHIGFAVLAGFSLAQALGRLYPRLWLRIPRPHMGMLLTLPFALLYLWVGDMPVPLQRAAYMLGFSALLLFLKRPRVLLDGLLAALFTILLFNPLALFDISLQFSALSVAVIALCAPMLTALAERFFPRSCYPGFGGSFLRGSFLLLGMSFCIQTAMAPLSIRIFGSSGLLFPLNMLWLPVLGSVVLPLAFAGFFLAAFGLDAASGLALRMAEIPCEALLKLLYALDGAGLLMAPVMPRPHWLATAGFWLLCLMLPGLVSPGPAVPGRLNSGKTKSAARGKRRSTRSFFSAHSWRKRPAQAAFTLCALLMIALPTVSALIENERTGVRLRVLDVGQGQSVLVEWSGLGGEYNAGRVLVDGGGFSGSSFDVGKAVVGPVLTDNALPRLNMVIASHPDTDHLGGLLFILENFSVRRYIVNGSAATPALAARESAAIAASGLREEVMKAGDTLPLAPGLRLEVLWPPQEMNGADRSRQQGRKIKEESSNNRSLVLRLVWEDAPLALLCGDAEEAALQALLALHTPDRLAAQVLLLPHHGSATGFSAPFYQAVSPALALVSCGYGNRWGFPSAAVVKALRESGIPLYNTAESGQIDLRWRSPKEKPAVARAREMYMAKPVPGPKPGS